MIATSSFVAIPIGSVPLTLQVLFVLLAGMVLGPRVGTLCVVAYLVLGLVAPVYAGGASGLGVLFGPTGGYLWGFVPAAALAGAICWRGRGTVTSCILGGLAGLAPIYALGATWLAVQLDLSAGSAIAAGVLPFVWTDVLKAVAAALAARAVFTLPLGLPSPERAR